jgi:uncharacterized protein
MIIPKEILPALNGAIPATLATASKDGIPNVGVMSQVFYANEKQLAISHQFFSKTSANLKENLRGHVQVIDPITAVPWFIEVELDHEETSGDLFEQMEMQLEAIASMCGMEDVFKLQAAYVFNVISIRKGDEVLRAPE